MGGAVMGGAGTGVGSTQMSTIQESTEAGQEDLEDTVSDDADLPALGYTLNKFMVDNMMTNLRVRRRARG